MGGTFTLKEKRLLTMKEFQMYSGIGRNNAFKLVHNQGFGIKIGKKIFVDRKAFDDWCDTQVASAS